MHCDPAPKSPSPASCLSPSSDHAPVHRDPAPNPAPASPASTLSHAPSPRQKSLPPSQQWLRPLEPWPRPQELVSCILGLWPRSDHAPTPSPAPRGPVSAQSRVPQPCLRPQDPSPGAAAAVSSTARTAARTRSPGRRPCSWKMNFSAGASWCIRSGCCQLRIASRSECRALGWEVRRGGTGTGLGS